MEYLTTLVGVKYAFFNEWDDSLPSRENDEAPFWVGEKFDLPNKEQLEEGGMCCVGMINLVRRFLNLSIPEYLDKKSNCIFIGGTEAWFKYLDKNKRLKPIDYNKRYEKGTLLIQDYNTKDQGHVAIVYNPRETLALSDIIHSQGAGVDQCVLIESIENSYNGFRYTHYCSDFLIND